MLRDLSVNDYAIIDDICIRLAPGLNVLTGETGAGKSIIVGALSFVLGERVSEDIIRKGSDRCRVEAVFDGIGERLASNLAESGTVSADASCLKISRELAREGRSRCTVNGKPISLARLRSLGDLLVDFHGQHEHQLLLHAKCHVDFLDGFAGLYDMRLELADRRRALIDLAKRIVDLEQEIASIKSKEDFIIYEIREIEQMDLKEGEDAEIECEISMLEHGEKIIEAGSEAMEAVYDGDDAAVKLIATAQVALRKIARYSEDLASLAERLNEAAVIVKDVAEGLRDRLSRIDLDSTRLEALRERRAIIERAKRKYGETLADVLTHLRRLKAGLENRDDLDFEVVGLVSEKAKLETKVAELAMDLSKRRKAAGKRFERLVETELKSLGIDGGNFRVIFEDLEEGDTVTGAGGMPTRVNDTGMDHVEFFVRTNRGEDLLPLRRIASGGEISRVMLALKKILADVDEVGTLVFDEIDSGIGGSIAGVIAAKLREVSESRQVICITHLPQIAAPAELHLAVGKASLEGRTLTDVTRVDGEDRVREIARMIGGRKPPKSARLHAEEILKRAVTR